MMPFALLYLLGGVAFTLWVASYHKTPTVRAWEWLLVIATWPIEAIALMVMLYQYVQRTLKRP